jgi:hypothetical protein
MGVNVLPVPDDRRRDFHEVLGLVFGFEPTEADHERFDLYFPWDRSRGAFDGESLVGTLGAFSLDMTVPGGTMACGGTTVVSVLPTHRRRGILRMMIDSHLAEVRDKEEPIAGLWASDSAIYGRFGYGSAARATEIEIGREHAGFHRLVPEPAPVRLIDKEEAGRSCPASTTTSASAIPGCSPAARPGGRTAVCTTIATTATASPPSDSRSPNRVGPSRAMSSTAIRPSGPMGTGPA